LLDQIVEPWYDSLSDPEETQRSCLEALLRGYSKTEYGSVHGASGVTGIDEYRSSFPPADYASLSPYFRRVMDGDEHSILPEPALQWVMTRGTTGSSKLLPATETHLAQILSIGARAVVNFALRKDPEVLQTAVLNLNFPSVVSHYSSSKGTKPYGYSSGTYARLNPGLQGANLVPLQEEIDALGGGITNDDWENRFELVYQRARDVDIGSLMGVTPVMVAFARYVRRKHGSLPKEFWKPRGLFCTSVTKIQTNYRPLLQRSYGNVPVVEMYTATEGIFAQQLDDLPYVSPNYDAYLFEVVTRRGPRMLHELRPNEWGRLVVSTPTLPRYIIGDLIEALGRNYFRVFGRDNRITVSEHLLFNLVTARF
jgi:hypothetical protein